MSNFELPGLGSGPMLGAGVRLPRLLGAAPRAVAIEGEPIGGGEGAAVPSAGFGDALADALSRVDGLSKEVGDGVKQMATGEPVALHDLMLSMGKSEVAFNLMLEVRNKFVDAWEKLSRAVV